MRLIYILACLLYFSLATADEVCTSVDGSPWAWANFPYRVCATASDTALLSSLLPTTGNPVQDTVPGIAAPTDASNPANTVTSNTTPGASNPANAVTSNTTPATSNPSIPGGNTTASTPPTSPPTKPDNLWERVRNGFALKNDNDNPRVTNQLNWYTQRPNYVNRMMDRSKRYLYHILSEVEKRGMPSEIALLPMVESAYNPMAYSVGHASGIWQFLPATGKNYGLHENAWYDGRRDIIAATNAALTYLNRLHQQFGTWELALAAYNCGEGCVQRAIEHNQRLGLPTDYKSLPLPAETRDYVPKLMAVKELVSDPSATGIPLQNIPDKAYFTTVKLDKPIDVSLAAQLANMPINDFLSLNPAFSKPVIRSDNNAELILPVDRADVFTNNLDHYDAPLVSWQGCDVHAGETPAKAAKRCHVTLATLTHDNHLELNHKGRFKTNQTLVVPTQHASPMAEDVSAGTSQTDNTNIQHDIPSQHDKKRTVTIQHGDRWSHIARRYHVSETELRQLNAHVSMKAGNVIELPASHADITPGHSGRTANQHPAHPNKHLSSRHSSATNKHHTARPNEHGKSHRTSTHKRTD